MEDNYLITPNIIRALKKCKQNKLFLEDLVDPMVRTELLEILNAVNNTDQTFSIDTEFHSTYQIVKTNLANNSDDTQLLNTAQRFLQFMLSNELKLNGIAAVKAFKEAVFLVLDEEDDRLKDRVIEKFNSIVEV